MNNQEAIPKHNELTFQVMVDSSPNALVLVNNVGKIVYINTYAEQLFQYQRSEIIGKEIEILIPNKFKHKDPSFKKSFYNNLEARTMDVGHDLYAIKKNGTKFPVEIGLNPIVTVDGNLVLTSITDITERKKAAELMRMIVESAPNSMVLVNDTGIITLINTETEKLFGYTREELIGQKIEVLIPNKFREKHPNRRENFAKKPEARSMGIGRDLYALKKNKEEFPVEIGLNPIETSEGKMVLASIIDITERKKAEELMRMIVESAPNSMVLVNDTGIITLINTETEKLFGYTREELIGQKIEVLIPNKFREKHPNRRENFAKKPEARSMGIGRDLYALKKNKEEFPVEIGLNPIETSEGKMVLASIIDITERKKAEEVAVLYTRKLESKNKELEQFSFITSHDLQEPLLSISSLIDILEEDYKDDFDEGAKDIFNYLNRSTDRMTKLIKALLDYSLLGSNTKMKKVDTNELVNSVCKDLNVLVSKNKATIHTKNLPILFAYQTELRLLFQNLICNAIKFKKPDTFPIVHISSKKQKNGWQFTVKDNGIGIDLAFKEKIFVIFEQLNDRQQYDGTGIGLAHCKKIIEMHDGIIWVDSEPNKGSEFHFIIPNKVL